MVATFSKTSGAMPAPTLVVYEVVLHGADGLDWGALCHCDLGYSIPRSNLTALRATVSVV